MVTTSQRFTFEGGRALRPSWARTGPAVSVAPRPARNWARVIRSDGVSHGSMPRILHAQRRARGLAGADAGRGGRAEMLPQRAREPFDAGDNLVGGDLAEAEAQVVAGDTAGLLVGLEAVVARHVQDAALDAVLEERRAA